MSNVHCLQLGMGKQKLVAIMSDQKNNTVSETKVNSKPLKIETTYFVRNIAFQLSPDKLV